MAKLTLHVDKDLITAAKEEAATRDTSVSKLVSDFFRVLAATPVLKRGRRLPPITASLVGCIRGAESDMEAYIEHLERKHS